MYELRFTSFLRSSKARIQKSTIDSFLLYFLDISLLTFAWSLVLKISSQYLSLFLIIKVYYVPGTILSTSYLLYLVILTIAVGN